MSKIAAAASTKAKPIAKMSVASLNQCADRSRARYPANNTRMAAAAATASGNCQFASDARCATRPTHNATTMGTPMAASGLPDPRLSWSLVGRSAIASNAPPAMNALTHDSSAEVRNCASKRGEADRE